MAGSAVDSGCDVAASDVTGSPEGNIGSDDVAHGFEVIGRHDEAILSAITEIIKKMTFKYLKIMVAMILSDNAKQITEHKL